ncbi:hypothetical protein ACHQM5_030687 [Ranunculus cassubicifolius]
MGSAASSETLESPPNSTTLDSNQSSQSLDPSNQTPAPPSDQPNNEESKPQDDDDDDDEGECPFCLYMKGGGCKDTFVAWEDCIEAAEKEECDVADKCFEVTSALKKCMEAHSEYYEPILKAEKVAEAEAVKELENDKKAEAVASGDDEKDAVIQVTEEKAGSEKKTNQES